MSRRQLHVAAEVAQAIPAAYLAQLQAVVDDPDNRCARCGGPITGASVEAVILCDENVSTVRLAHPKCARSGVYQASGMRASVTARITDPEGTDINTTLGRRQLTPRALVFLEPIMLLSLAPSGGQLADVEDPLAVYATQRGLEPITGRLDQITPEPTTTSRLHVQADGLLLTNPLGQDTIPADPDVLADWCTTARDDHHTADRHHRPRPRPHPTADDHQRGDRHPTRLGRPSQRRRPPPTTTTLVAPDHKKDSRPCQGTPAGVCVAWSNVCP